MRTVVVLLSILLIVLSSTAWAEVIPLWNAIHSHDIPYGGGSELFTLTGPAFDQSYTSLAYGLSSDIASLASLGAARSTDAGLRDFSGQIQREHAVLARSLPGCSGGYCARSSAGQQTIARLSSLSGEAGPSPISTIGEETAAGQVSTCSDEGHVEHSDATTGLAEPPMPVTGHDWANAADAMSANARQNNARLTVRIALPPSLYVLVTLYEFPLASQYNRKTCRQGLRARQQMPRISVRGIYTLCQDVHSVIR